MGDTTENGLLYTIQSGFRSKRSTSTALLQMTDTLLNNMDKGKVTGVVYLDFKKAFDTVNHSLLLRKLGAYGVDKGCFPLSGIFRAERNFSFVFFELVLPESSHTKKNSAPRGIFRLVENSLKGCIESFRSYLTHPTQCTNIGKVSSAQQLVTVGVPQGSVLGPLLFLVYLNDMPECLKPTQATLFPDDPVMYCSGSTRCELQEKLNGDLFRIK